MSSYINNRPRTAWETGIEWSLDLSQRLRWLYGNPHERMTSPLWRDDLTAWKNLGRPK